MQPSQPATPEQQLRILPILVAAMMAGMVVFAGIAAAVGPVGGAPPTGSPTPQAMRAETLLAILGVLLAACLAAFFVIGRTAQGQARRAWESRADDEDGRARLVAVLLTSTIVRAGLVEGPGLFACVIVLLTGNLLPLAVAALAVGVMASLLPVRARLARLEEAATGVRRV